MESNKNAFKNFILRVVKLIESVPSFIDCIVRWVDDLLGRKRDFLKRRSILAFLFPVPVFLFIVLGPSLARDTNGDIVWRGGTIAFALIAGVLILQLIYFIQDKVRGMAWIQLSLIIVLVILTLYIAEPEAVQASTDLYYHYYSFLAVIAMLVAIPVAALLKHCKFFAPPETTLADLHRAYDAEQVAAQGEPRKLNIWDVIGAYGQAVLGKPLHVVGIVAIVVLALPPENLKFWTFITFILSLMLIATSIYDPKRDAFDRLFQRVFLSGGTLLVTLAIILLAILRLAGVDYVTTVLDAGSKRTLFSYIISTYALLWFYDFWINQAIVDLVIKNKYFSDNSETIRRHGGGRIAIINTQKANRMFEPAAFLLRIAQIAQDTNRESLLNAAKKVEQQFKSFAAVCLLLFAGTPAIIGYYIHRTEQKPGIFVGKNEKGAFNLSEHLVSSSGDPVIMLAASGGGTRAALYTAVVLRGLSNLGQLDRMVLASGVSGGSAALAYYAIHRPRSNDNTAWKNMIDTLSSPFIDDVLAGAAEYRIVSNYRLGKLLTESFERRFLGTAPTKEVKQRTTFNAVKDIGLIFNTSLCGSPAADIHANYMESKLSAGGRLVITNLTSNFDKQTFSKDNKWHPDIDYEIVRPSKATLFEAASLSANFPPVFSNAAVKVDGTPPFWVTDGGAVENRGVISILLALAETLDSILSEKQKVNLADIRIIVADASAFNPKYKSDRGMGAKFGSSEQLANRLIAELITRTSQLHKSITKRDNGIQVFYLPMPDAMRAKGTFGTHWMMPDEITLQNPLNGKEGIEIKKEDLKELVVAMFSKEYSKDYLLSKWPKDIAEQIWEETKNAWHQMEACFN